MGGEGEEKRTAATPWRFLQRGARRGGWAGREDAQICKVIKILDKAETKLGEKLR